MLEIRANLTHDAALYWLHQRPFPRSNDSTKYTVISMLATIAKDFSSNRIVYQFSRSQMSECLCVCVSPPEYLRWSQSSRWIVLRWWHKFLFFDRDRFLFFLFLQSPFVTMNQTINLQIRWSSASWSTTSSILHNKGQRRSKLYDLAK